MTQEVILTVANTNITPTNAPQAGVFLIVFVRHDNTNNQRQITWDPLFRLASVGIDEYTPNNNNVYTFHGRIDPADNVVKWFNIGLPVIGEL